MALNLLLALITVVALSLVYLSLRPRAIPGIPYNKKSRQSIFGDIPRLATYVKKHHDPFKWMMLQCQEMGSPVVQVWIRPGRGPNVIVSDFRESQDILARRAKEFERANFFGDILGTIIPHATIIRKTDEKFRVQRRAFADTMSPSFISKVAAPRSHEAVASLVKLWQGKRSLACGRPTSISDDINNTIFDAIWATTFGSQLGSSDIQFKALASSSEKLGTGMDEPIFFPKGPLNPIIDAILTIARSVESIISSPFPRLHHWILFRLPPLSSASKLKSQTITKILALSRAKFATKTIDDDLGDVQSATDLVLRQEAKALSKGQDGFSDTFLHDELHAFLVAGGETTATTCQWTLKYLSNNPRVQRKLRASLEMKLKIFRQSPLEIIDPGAANIMNTPLPYLDAVIEESLRYAGVASGVFREATVDTQILGYSIPKGTEVLLANAGPGYTAPPLGFSINEHNRSETSRDAKDKTHEWDNSNIGDFSPERWLAEDAAGEIRYNPNAGPSLPFSTGVRGCFGKRLAYAELRILLALVVINFDIQSPPANLNTYNAEVKVTRAPLQCYVRLGEISKEGTY